MVGWTNATQLWVNSREINKILTNTCEQQEEVLQYK